MNRGPWTLEADRLRQQRRQRLVRHARSEIPFAVIAFLVGALGVGWFILRPDLSALLAPDTPFATVPADRPVAAYPYFAMCSASLGRDCIIDGDTFRLGREKMRIANIDAPETYTGICGGAREVALGKEAAARLQLLMNSGGLAIERQGHDRYGRTLVRVRAGGHDVGERLVNERLARHWPNGDEFWCR
jgi:endonuclease YncB( thermonuclease family)